jgi:hypothetical protein
MKQMYDFGKAFKSYYRNFLTSDYDRTRFYARTNDMDRALESAYPFIAGLYEPNSDKVWNQEPGLYKWLPVSVHTSKLSNDDVKKKQITYFISKTK